MEVSGYYHAPASLPPRRGAQYPVDRREGGPQRQSGHGGEGNILYPAGNQTQVAQTVA
jgi:hypothetical protein